MKPILDIKDLSMNADLGSEAMSSISGGFFALLAGCTFVKRFDERVGESECNNGICVPYQDEDGNY